MKSLYESIKSSVGIGEIQIPNLIIEKIKEVFGKPAMQEFNTYIYHVDKKVDMEQLLKELKKFKYSVEIDNASISYKELIRIFNRKNKMVLMICECSDLSKLCSRNKTQYEITLYEEFEDKLLW